VTVLNPEGRSRYVLTCEHASRYIPPRYRGLGLPESELARHIAWDIGVEAVSRSLAARIDAPLFLSGYSRLLIDCNRPTGVPSGIPVLSELTEIPGNRGLEQAERDYRANTFYWPYQTAIADHLDARERAGRPTAIVSVHSFTPVFKGFQRPWHAGVLFRRSVEFGTAMVEALRAPGLVVDANEPYQISDDGDYVVPVHGESRGLDIALLEIRQDLIADAVGAAAWAARLERALAQLEAGYFASR
jgi:predicted N-formylglutamate amidohydrolase